MESQPYIIHRPPPYVNLHAGFDDLDWDQIVAIQMEPYSKLHSFSRLPAEVRQMIWDLAIRHEAKKERWVLITRAKIHGYRPALAPVKHLISRFLVTSRESRARAQAFYNVKVDMQVFEMANPPTWDELHPRFPGKYLPRLDIVQRTRTALRGTPKAGGVAYISLEHDRFVAVSCSASTSDYDLPESRVVLWGYGAYAKESKYRPSRYVYAPIAKALTWRIPEVLLMYTASRRGDPVYDYLWFIVGYFRRQVEYRVCTLGTHGFLDDNLTSRKLSLAGIESYIQNSYKEVVLYGRRKFENIELVNYEI